MDNKDLSMMAALAKSIGGGGSSGPTIPTPTSGDSGKVIKVDDEGAYGLALDEGQSTFAGLTDVALTDPTDGQVPVYDGTTNKWKNGSVGGSSLPDVTSADENKVLGVVNGNWGIKPSFIVIDITYDDFNKRYTMDKTRAQVIDLITNNNNNVVLKADDRTLYTYSGKVAESPTESGKQYYSFSAYTVGGYWNEPLRNHKLRVIRIPTIQSNVKSCSFLDIPVLPIVSSDDNGKILKVVDGKWTAVTPE